MLGDRGGSVIKEHDLIVVKIPRLTLRLDTSAIVALRVALLRQFFQLSAINHSSIILHATFAQLLWSRSHVLLAIAHGSLAIELVLGEIWLHPLIIYIFLIVVLVFELDVIASCYRRKILVDVNIATVVIKMFVQTMVLEFSDLHGS